MNREIVIPGGAGVYPLSGDVASQAGNSQVVVTGIQHVPVLDTFFDGQEYLKYDADTHQWIPTRIEGSGNKVFATPADGSEADAALRSLVPADLPVATTSAIGAVKPDGTTIIIDTNGTIKSVSATGITLQTNGTNNGSQEKLNLVAGTNVTLTDDGTGDVTIAAVGAGGYSLGGTLGVGNIAITVAGAGAGGSATVTGLDGIHRIVLTTGTGCLGSSEILAVTFTTPRGNTTYPIGVLNPGVGANYTSFDEIVSFGPSGTIPTPSYIIKSGVTALTDNTVYVWDVSCP